MTGTSGQHHRNRWSRWIGLYKKEAELTNKKNRHRDYLEQGLASIDDISGFYKKSSVKIRQAILVLVLSDKLVYDNNGFHNVLFNSTIKLISKPNKNV